MKIYVLGAGPGSPEFLTRNAEKIIRKSHVILAPERLSERFRHLNKLILKMGIGEITAYVKMLIDLNINVTGDLKEHEELKTLYALVQLNEPETREPDLTVCVLVSGDTGFYSMARKLKSTSIELIFEPGISSLAYFAAKLETSYDDAKLLSLHGREGAVIPAVSYNPKVFLLTGGHNKVSHIIEELCEAGLSHVFVSVGENLSDESERIVKGSADELRGEEFDNLSVMMIENMRYVNFYGDICDEEITRGTRPMTKESVRAVSLAALSVAPTDNVLDMGAGTGAVSLALARKAFDGMVYSIEREPEGIELIKANREKFGAYNIKVIEGTAPEVLLDLPKIDKAFIGGSGGSMAEIMEALQNNNPDMAIVINAVTLETLQESRACLSEAGYSVEVTCITAAKGRPAGTYTMMQGENPVYIIKGSRQA